MNSIKNQIQRTHMAHMKAMLTHTTSHLGPRVLHLANNKKPKKIKRPTPWCPCWHLMDHSAYGPWWTTSPPFFIFLFFFGPTACCMPGLQTHMPTPHARMPSEPGPQGPSVHAYESLLDSIHAPSVSYGSKQSTHHNNLHLNSIFGLHLSSRDCELSRLHVLG